jgi:hypothetical protein
LRHCLTTNHREKKLKDPTTHVHHHALSTATSTLRNHLGKAHRADYDQICAQNGWKNNLAEAEKQKAETAKTVAQVATREQFSVEGLLKRIARFIVADDQVGRLLFFEVIYAAVTFSSNHFYSQSGWSNAQNSAICSFLHATISKMATSINATVSVI